MLLRERNRGLPLEFWMLSVLLYYGYCIKIPTVFSSRDTYKEQLKDLYSSQIKHHTSHYSETYNSYEKQHDAFVNHAYSTISSLKAQISALEEQIETAEQQKQQEEQVQQ